METRNYRILYHQEPEGGYTVTVPTLPGCVTYGEDIPQAIHMAREAIELYLESLVAHGEPVPEEHGTLEYLHRDYGGFTEFTERTRSIDLRIRVNPPNPRHPRSIPPL